MSELIKEVEKLDEVLRSKILKYIQWCDEYETLIKPTVVPVQVLVLVVLVLVVVEKVLMEPQQPMYTKEVRCMAELLKCDKLTTEIMASELD